MEIEKGDKVEVNVAKKVNVGSPETGLVHTRCRIGEGRGRRLAPVPPLCGGCQNQLQQNRMRPTDAGDTRKEQHQSFVGFLF